MDMIETPDKKEVSTSPVVNSPDNSKQSITLELGDIIEVISPANDSMHETSMFIEYIDNHQINLVNISTIKRYQLNINEFGGLTDESIIQINLLSRSDDRGYARQNNLLPKTWVHIHIGGDIPAIITGEITNLEEDMIEIITYPELKTIFIDFKYRGIPIDIPIDKIRIHEKPASLNKIGSLSLIRGGLEDGEEFEIPDEEFASIEFTDSGESIIRIPEDKETVENIHTVLRELYVDASTIMVDEDLGELSHVVELPEHEQRFGIDIQVNDMMDELLSTIPSNFRTKHVMNNIHNLIDKYKILRQYFSKFDANHNVYSVNRMDRIHKPLIQHIMKMDVRLQWLLPVIKMHKKVYTGSKLNQTEYVDDIITENSAKTTHQIQSLQDDYYERNANDDAKDFSLMQKRIQEIMNPFEPSQECIYSTRVLTDLEAIVDNLDDFNSTVYTRAGLSKRQYVIQRYNLGLTKPENHQLNGGKTVYTRTQMTENDTLCLKSLVMLPAPVMRFSTIQLPSTNMLNRASLHHQYFMLFRALRKNTEIIPHVIDNFEKELDYEKMGAETKQTIMEGINEFILGDSEHMDKEEKFEKFLECIIPQTRSLIKLFHKHIQNKMSMLSVVQQLEPFMVYMKDISYPQYKELRYFIKQQIKDLKIAMEKDSTVFGKLRNTKYDVVNEPNVILRLLAEKKDIADSFLQLYNIQNIDNTNIHASSHEMLYKLLSTDNGTLYMDAITTILISLMTPNNLMDVLSEPIIDDMTDSENIKTANCQTRYMAKKYSSVKEMQKDNNVDVIYFDKEYDDTPYSIIMKYKDEQKKLSPDTFIDFLAENLIQRHDCPKYMAIELAKTLIANKKEVVNGNYALLEIKPHLVEGVDESKMNESDKESMDYEADIRKKVFYYRRLKNNWIIDDDISTSAFIDTQTIFCNISKGCSRNDKPKICETDASTKIRIKNTMKDDMITEFDKRYHKSVEDIEKDLEDKLAYHVKLLKRNNMLHEVRTYKANNLAYELGKQANSADLIVSPNAKLRDSIMGQPDFSKKQYDICRFIEQFCREPLVEQLNESPHWFYCKDTNTKLFPASIFQLANTFTNGGDYRKKQDEICALVGVMSDDGDAIVDRESGFVIRLIDFSDEDGFDEAGFRVTAHAILDKDLGDTLMSTDKSTTKVRVFDSEDSEMIYNIATTLTKHINIPFESIDEFIMRFSTELIDKHLITEAAYGRRSEANLKKTGKSLGPYIKYKNETTIIIVASVLFISIQTATPSFTVNRTFPGCVRSFTGYPMSGIEDLSGIHYIACIVNRVKSSIKPWDSIQKMNSEKISANIKMIIENHIMKRSDMEELYTTKRLYNELNPDKLIPREHDIARWHHFMPPVTPFSVIKSLRPVSSDFKTELLATIKSGKSSQMDMIALLKSRISCFGYGIIEIVNKIVKDKELLLQTASRVPYVENSCCTDSDDLIKPMVYFNEQDGNIKILLQKSRNMIKLHQTVKHMTIPPSFYHADSTRLEHPSVPSGRQEDNIYAAVIYYCNFDKKLPIPEDLKSICNAKPDQYDPTWSLPEKVEFMKRHGNQYNVDTLNNMMDIINRRNLVSIEKQTNVDIVHGLNDIIAHLDNAGSELFDEPLREHLRAVLNQYNPQQMHDTASKELNTLTDYLTTCNQHLYKKLMAFFDDYGNLSNSDYSKLRDFLLKISEWNVDKMYGSKEHLYDEGLYTVIQYMHNAIIMIAKFYPTMLVNNAEVFKTVPKHWGLAKDHITDISMFLNKYYDKLEAFRGDATLIHILQVIDTQLADMNIFIQNIPVQTDIQREIIDEDGKKRIISFYSLFGKETLYALFTHCFYLTMCKYIDASDEPSIISIDIQTNKKTIREQNAELSHASTSMVALPSTGELDDTSITEVQIYTDTTNNDIKTRVASLLYAFLQVEMTNKKETNYSYDDVIKKVNLSKEREKKGFVDYLGDMSIENRKAEQLMKKYRLGKWNVGQQRGLVHYDKETYVRERGEMLTQLAGDVAGGNHDIVSELRREIYDMDADAEIEATAQEDMHAVDIQGLGDDYQDEAFYEEDRE
jgi:hypothetical protein